MSTNDTGGNGADGGNSVSSFSLDGLTLSADGDYCLWCLVHSDQTISTVQWNPDGGSAQNMVSVLSGTQSVDGYNWELFRLTNPTTRGAGQIDVTVGASGFIGIGSAAEYGVDTADPETDEDEVEGSGSGNLTNNVATAAGAGQICLGFHSFVGSVASESPGGSETELADGGRSAVYRIASGGSSQDVICSLSAARERAFIAFAVNDAAGGGGDPEGPLVGGKLLRGGLLMKGRLVR